VGRLRLAVVLDGAARGGSQRDRTARYVQKTHDCKIPSPRYLELTSSNTVLDSSTRQQEAWKRDCLCNRGSRLRINRASGARARADSGEDRQAGVLLYSVERTQRRMRVCTRRTVVGEVRGGGFSSRTG
jgi:hypothetical protein